MVVSKHLLNSQAVFVIVLYASAGYKVIVLLKQAFQ